MFDQLETTDKGTKIDLKDVLSSLNFNKDGLIPAIAQDVESKQVLMLAWMDLTAIQTTLKEGNVCYWSRSRNTYWRKGETSNHFQRLVEMRIDCDGDTIPDDVDNCQLVQNENQIETIEFNQTLESQQIKID